MRASFVLCWVGVGTLALVGCGDDSGVSPEEGSSSGGAESTSTGTPPITTVDSTDTGVQDDDGTTAAQESSSGTTAAEESSTGPVELCGNDAIDGEEICDGTDLDGQDCAQQGFDGGDLACNADCGGYDTSGCVNFNCGNGTVEGKEACDGNDLGGATCQGEGFGSGEIDCTLNCALDTSGCGTCGNVIVDGDEVCDNIVLLGQTCESQGFSSGQLGCSADCLTYDFANCITCGNDVIDGVEPCDGVDLGGATCVSEGYVGGQLACAADCSGFDITGCNTCGNALVDPGESCDGANLNGQDCVSLGLTGGTLSCAASCQFDLSQCDIPGLPFGNDVGYNGYSITGAPLPCDNILATGTGTGLTDDSNQVVNIGFSFPFYGVNYTQVNIESNGALNFGTMDYMTLANACLPTNTAPSTNNLYVFWDDLNPSATGASEVYYQTLGAVGNRRFVVQWETAHFSGDTNDLIRVQAMLDEASGQISVCYPDTLSAANVGNNGAEATAGIQQSSTVGFDFSCNTADLVNGLQLLYVPL